MKTTLMVAAILCVASAAQAQLGGTTIRSGNITFHYDASGNPIGTSYHNGTMTQHYGPRSESGLTLDSGNVSFDYGYNPYRVRPLNEDPILRTPSYQPPVYQYQYRYGTPSRRYRY